MPQENPFKDNYATEPGMPPEDVIRDGYYFPEPIRPHGRIDVRLPPNPKRDNPSQPPLDEIPLSEDI